MKYLKLYERFQNDQAQILEPDISDLEISDKTIDDILSPDFFDDMEEDEGSYINSNGVIYIKNWKIY